MAKTYLDIVNIVLRDTNEVPLTAGDFATARGLQAFVKEAVNRALLDITNYNDEWPWMAHVPSDPGDKFQSHTFSTVAGVSEYLLPSGIDQIDWDNIVLTDPAEPDSVIKLEFVSYNQVTRQPVTEGEPYSVYQPPNGTYMGLFPKPETVWTVDYLAFKEPTLLVGDADTLPFEDRYYPVLVSRARYYTWMFRENSQQASMALNEYEDSLRQMLRNLISPSTNTMSAV